MNVGMVLLLNILVALVWYAMQPAAGPGNFILGFAVGFLMLALVHRPYGRRTWAAAAYVVFLIWSIIKSSIQVAAIILSPHGRLRQGIVAIPVDTQNDFELAALATSITLTPGTLSIDVGENAEGQRVLYVHNLVVDDPETMRREIKEDFEKRILRFSR